MSPPIPFRQLNTRTFLLLYPHHSSTVSDSEGQTSTSSLKRDVFTVKSPLDFFPVLHRYRPLTTKKLVSWCPRRRDVGHGSEHTPLVGLGGEERVPGFP